MKKMLSVLISIAILITNFLGFSAFAETTELTLDGDGYYLITSSEDFTKVANAPAANYKITADIEVSASIPEFSGKLVGEKPDGNKPEITITSLDTGSTENGGIIKLLNSGTVENIAVYSENTVITKGKIGMIVGISNGGTIKNCDNYASFSPTYDNVGGILGYTNSGKTVIENCNNYGNVSSSRHNIGGILGASEYNATTAATPVNTIINCHNYGNITAGGPIGGIAGMFYGEKIENCSNSGNISGSSSPVGGIVGNIDCLVNKCFNSGNITGSGAIAAGIAGTTSNGNNSDVSLTNCYNSGSVTNTNAQGNSCGISYMVGKSGANATSTVSANYNCGVVSGGRVVVETVAVKAPATPAASNNYYLIRDTGNGNNNNSTALTDDQMKSLSSFVGFDNTIWAIIYGDTYLYPQLIDNNKCDDEVYTVSITVNGNGEVNKDSLSYVKNGAEFSVTFTPEHKIEYVKANGDKVSGLTNQSYTYTTTVTENISIEVSFIGDVLILDEDGYYLVTSSNDFTKIANAPDANYKITADIEVSSSIPTFSGKLIGEKSDGSKPEITLTSATIALNKGGIIDTLAGGTVENLKVVSDVTTEAKGKSGAIAGISTGGTIRNCDNYISFAKTGNYVGGILGYTNSGTTVIENCNNYGSITTTQQYIGGIIGASEYNETTATTAVNTIVNCHNYGAITAQGSTGGIIGGIAGHFFGKKIENCSNSAKLTVNKENAYSGGIVGRLDSLVNKCFNSGDIDGGSDSTFFGGIAGSSYDYASYNTEIGITNCYNSGHVYGGADTRKAGIAYKVGNGSASSVKTKNVSIFGNYNTGKLTKADMKTYEGSVLITLANYTDNYISGKNYFNKEIAGTNAQNGQSITSNGTVVYHTALTGDQMKSLSSFEGFNNTVWAIIHGDTYLYPQLIDNLQCNDEVYTVSITQTGNGTIDKDALAYVKNGTDFSITFTPESKIEYVKVNGNEVCGTTNQPYTYTITAVSADAEIEVSFVEDVFVQDEDGYWIVDTADKFSQIEASGNYKITADITVSKAIPEFSGKLIGEKADGSKPKIKINSLTATSTEAGGVIDVLNSGTVENIAVYSENTVITKGYVGMIVGKSMGGIIKDCDNYASFAPTYNNVGGILGYTNSGKTLIENCNNYGDATAGENRINLGGILGASEYNEDTASTPVNEIINCHNYGNLQIYGSSGGIAGYFYGLKIENCSNIGNITVDYFANSYSGGIVGNLDTLVNKCYNRGNIIVKNVGVVGGIAGGTQNDSKNPNNGITNCFNTGNIIIEESAIATVKGFAAGIACSVGIAGNAETTEFHSNYNTGKLTVYTDENGETLVSGTETVIAICGVSSTGENSTQVYDKEIYEKFKNNYHLERDYNGRYNYSKGLSLSEMKDITSFGFDTNIWHINESGAYKLPQLKGNEYKLSKVNIPDSMVAGAKYLYKPEADEQPTDENVQIINGKIIKTPYFISYSKAEIVDDFDLEAGFLYSKTVDLPEIGIEGVIKAPADSINEGSFGVLFHGAGLDLNSVYYTRDYAIYSRNGEEYIIYGTIGGSGEEPTPTPAPVEYNKMLKISEPVRDTVTQSCAVTKNGDDYYYCTASRNGGIVSYNFTNGGSSTLEIPDIGTPWVVRGGTDGNFYIGGSGLRIYNPVSNSQEFIGSLSGFGVYTVGAITEGENGVIYLGCDNGCIIKYDPANKTYSNIMEPAVSNSKVQVYEGITTYKSILYKDGYLYAGGYGNGIKGIIKINPDNISDKVFINIDSVTNKQYPYALSSIGKYIFVTMQPADILFAIDTENNNSLISFEGSGNVSMSYVQSLDDENFGYYCIGATLYKVDLRTKEITALPGTSADGSHSLKALRNNGLAYVLIANDEDINGKCLVTMGNNGSPIIYNIDTNIGKTYTNVKAPEGWNPTSVVETDPVSGNVYIGTSFTGVITIYNPENGTISTVPGNNTQTDSILAYNGKMYFGQYPHANLMEYDPEKNETILIANLGNDIYSQNRIHSLCVGDNKIFMGTIADYNELQGSLSWYDLITGEVVIKEGLIEDQSIVNVCYKDGKIYGSTSVYGGHATTPSKTNAVIFIYDLLTEELTSFTPDIGTDVPFISGLSFDNNGNMLCVIANGLYKINPETHEVTEIYVANKIFSNGQMTTFPMVYDNYNNLYVCVNGLKKFNLTDNTYTEILNGEYEGPYKVTYHTLSKDGKTLYVSPYNDPGIYKVNIK